jgi:hypothetical protein
MLRPKIYYEDGATPAGSNAPTTLTYNYGGETITVDLSNPESVKLAQDRLSKGHNMEKIAEERNKLKAQAEKLQQTVDAWNDRLEAARSDPAEMQALVGDLENYIGRPLTRAEERAVASDNADFDDPVMKELLNLKKEFTTYREQQTKAAQEREIQAEARKLVAKLDEMEHSPDKYPGFDREKVYELAREKGTTDFEMVYYYLNRDAFVEAERKKIEAEFKQLTDKRKAAATEGDASPASLNEPPKTFRKVADVGRALRDELKTGKVSFFTDD